MFTNQTGSCLVDFKTSLGFENLIKHSSSQKKPHKPLVTEIFSDKGNKNYNFAFSIFHFQKPEFIESKRN
jgi:hypothetical protein